MRNETPRRKPSPRDWKMAGRSDAEGGTTAPGAFKGVLAERNVSRPWAGKRREGRLGCAAVVAQEWKQRERPKKMVRARLGNREAAEQGATKSQRPNKPWRIPIRNKKPSSNDPQANPCSFTGS
jgi:hypothetical protein